MQHIENKYAKLLVNYCLDVNPGDRVLVKSTLLAEPLVKEVYREVLRSGGNPEVTFIMEGQNEIFYQEAKKKQLQYVSPLLETAMKSFEKYIFIRAPYNLMEDQEIDPKKRQIASKATAQVYKHYFKRTGNGEMDRNLCQYPTQASAQMAGMSLEAYREFVFNACNLYAKNPEKEWLKVRKFQQSKVDHLNKCSQVRYRTPEFDISFSTKGRTWMNSDGRTNMPSGEVYTSPVEDSVNGTVHFSFPTVFMGEELEGITLWVKDGLIHKWEAKKGQQVLDKAFSVKGATRFGEAAIGTNMNIQRVTKNILFDEKIGGSVHMAIGQSYKQCGGKNESSIHWDMITDMTDGGEIHADGEVIYKNGKFTI